MWLQVDIVRMKVQCMAVACRVEHSLRAWNVDRPDRPQDGSTSVAQPLDLLNMKRSCLSSYPKAFRFGVQGQLWAAVKSVRILVSDLSDY